MPKDDWLRLAILYDESAKYSSSNPLAIQKFIASAKRHQIDVTLLTTDYDISLLSSFNALFIRDTTDLHNNTYSVSMLAQILGLKVIDSPIAIIRGCNKIWQIDMFEKNKIPYPKTYIINYDNYENASHVLHYPIVMKTHDSCFSQGIWLARDHHHFMQLAKEILNPKTSNYEKLICQQFIPTNFDWRICILEKKILFACKYYMADGDWKITKYDENGNGIDGAHESVAIKDVPNLVLAMALNCVPFLDDGLYGIDIKETPAGCYIIEVNDNPSIDAGVEDEAYGDYIYDTIMGWFKKDATINKPPNCS